MLKWLLKLFKLYKLSTCRMALKLQLCFLSSNFWECALFSLIGVEVFLLVLRVGRPFNAYWLLGFVYVILFSMF
jgi:hypothetical protein